MEETKTDFKLEKPTNIVVQEPVAEAVPVFKFKKAKKTLGNLDIADINKWAMLIKRQYQGDTLFQHYVFQRDKESNNVMGIQIYEGFMKGERFVVTRSRSIMNKGFNDFDVLKRFNTEIEKLVDQGFVRDESQYLFGEPGNPSYYKDPEEEEEEDENDPEADLKKAHQMITLKKNNLLQGITKQITNINLANPNPEVEVGTTGELEDGEGIKEVFYTPPATDLPAPSTGFSLFKRKPKV